MGAIVSCLPYEKDIKMHAFSNAAGGAEAPSPLTGGTGQLLSISPPPKKNSLGMVASDFTAFSFWEVLRSQRCTDIESTGE